MERKTKYVVIAFVLIGFALMVAGYAGAAEEKGVSANPIKDTIDKTASIKEMQAKPAPAPSYKFDVLGNRLPAQTDNAGKIAR